MIAAARLKYATWLPEGFRAFDALLRAHCELSNHVNFGRSPRGHAKTWTHMPLHDIRRLLPRDVQAHWPI